MNECFKKIKEKDRSGGEERDEDEGEARTMMGIGRGC
jgi:hypothetical protein